MNIESSLSECRALGIVDKLSRIVVEKPIGTNTESARVTNDAIGAAFDESQVFRIDHYLGKEAVQNLLALRFANSILSRYGTPTPSNKYKSPSPKRSALTDAGRFTMAPAHCAIWCKVTCYSYSVWSRWNRRPTTHHRPCVTKK